MDHDTRNNSPYRIGIDARFLLRPLRGIPLYVARLCQYLPAANRNYHFFYFINKGFEHNDKPQSYLPLIEGIAANNSNVTFVNRNDDAEIRWEQVFLPRLIKDCDIDLLHMPANRACFFSGVPMVVTVHDVMEYLYLKSRYRNAMAKSRPNLKKCFYLSRMAAYAWGTYRFGMDRSSEIITVSDYSARDISSRLRIDPGKISVIHHGMDEEFCAAADQTTGSSSGAKFVLMLGGDSYQKNPEGAIAAWANVSEKIRMGFQLKIVGFCGNEQSPLLEALKKHGLRDGVEVRGWVSQSELIQYMRNASLFLYLSRYEGFGFPLLHAMASGIPIISSNKSSIPEVLGDVGFQFEPDDYLGVARGIERILSDRRLQAVQAEKGIVRSMSFSWAKSVSRHLEVYERCLSHRKKGVSNG